MNFNNMNTINQYIICLFLTLVFSSNMTPPSIPSILAVGGDGIVTITWDRVAESSIDDFTNYADFEGYRLYRSTDGGITWGSLETDIIPKDGQIVGWRPIQQYDLSELQDLERCVYSNNYGDDCIDDPLTETDESLLRSVDVSGADPIAPWFYLGNNSSLFHSYIDDDVINGVEYTYAITAYDMGVKIDTVLINNINGQITLDTIWNASNPGEFSCPSQYNLTFNQCPSFESPKFSESFTDYNSNGTWDEGEPWIDENNDLVWNEIRQNLINIVTVTPANSASDISFPDVEQTENFIIPNSLNVGTGNATYRFVDENALEQSIVKFEVQADRNIDSDEGLSDNDGDFEDFSSRNPEIFAYRVNSDGSLFEGFYNIIENYKSVLTNEEIDFYFKCTNYYNASNQENCEAGPDEIIEDDPATENYDESSDNGTWELDAPGAIVSNNGNDLHIPYYYVENHPLLFSNELYYENNFTEWFNGLQFRFDNYWSELPQTNDFATFDSIEFYKSNDESNPFLEQVFSDLEIDFDNDGTTDFSISLGDIELEYWNSGFTNRAMFDYKIEFSSTEHIDTSYRTFPNGDYCIDVSINNPGWDGNRDQATFLPVKVTNLTTGRPVRVWHSDRGVYDSEDVNVDGFTQSDVPGYNDCVWQPNEKLSFAYDMLAYGDDLSDIDDQKTFELNLKYDLNSIRGKYGQEIIEDDETGFSYYESFDSWNSELIYSKNDIVEVGVYHPQFGYVGNNGIYQAKRDIDNTQEIYPNFCGDICPPNAVYDNDGDNLNDNPWQQLFPWDEGDYIIVKPDKWFNDGDSWTVDFSLIGKKESLTYEMLDSVLVVPNPYVVSSAYNEEVYGNRLLFDKLPQQCTIKIFTVTGEIIKELNHGGNNNLAGSIPWDLRNTKGELVNPGLYFYSVEADGVNDNKIGKFVIIR